MDPGPLCCPELTLLDSTDSFLEVHSYSPSTSDVEAKIGFWGYSGLYNELKTSRDKWVNVHLLSIRACLGICPPKLLPVTLGC